MYYLVVILVFSILLFSVILHEIAHGYTALLLGDTTARDAGRLTLNPLKHLDPWGSVLIPILLHLAGAIPIGWAKPVPVNVSLMRDPKRGMMLVAASGPLTNITLAMASALLLRALPSSGPAILVDFFKIACQINIVLALFNLIPIPPLDGSNLLAGILPPRIAERYVRLGQYGIFIILALLYVAFEYEVLDKVVGAIFRILVPA